MQNRILPTGMLVCAAFLFSCQTAGPTPRANPCANGSPNAPAIVCVGDTDLTVKPAANPTEVHGRRSGAIHWHTVSGTGSLAILFENPDVLREITCDHQGYCKALVDPQAKTGTPFKYTIVLQKGGVVAPPNDPIIIIDP